MGTDPDRDGGDPVCWLQQTCPQCGAMPTDDPAEPADRCWRCGTPRPDDVG